MKTIEKETKYGCNLIFEIIANKKELREWMKWALMDGLSSKGKDGTWEDEDSSIWWMDKDGEWDGTEIGCPVKRPNISNIKKMISSNPSTTVIYGDIEIFYDEEHDEWLTSE